MIDGEQLFLGAWHAYDGLEAPEREYHFDPTRKWRFDFAWPSMLVAVEIEGATFGRSRHTSGKGFAADCEKYNAATLAGWRVLRFTTSMMKDDPDAAVELVIAVMNGKKGCQNSDDLNSVVRPGFHDGTPLSETGAKLHLAT